MKAPNKCNCTEQRSSLNSDSRSDCQENPRLLWILNNYYHAYNSLHGDATIQPVKPDYTLNHHKFKDLF
jgi:hypothetical protein